MGYTVVTAPAETPISLADAKLHLRLNDDDADDLVRGLLDAAIALIENDTRRALVTRTMDFTIDYDWPRYNNRDSARYNDQWLDDPWLGGCRRIVLPFPPLQSVTSITYVDNTGATQTLAADQYLVNKTGIEGVIEPAYAVTWPTVRRQMNAITVRFVCGYGAADVVPEPLKQAMKLLLWNWHDNPGATTAGQISEVPMAVDSLTFPYRVFY
jgi:uncharacterized phiE125 gp8 family phage protein